MPALLDTYEQERIPVAQRLLETTDRAFQVVVSEGWLAAAAAHDDHRARRRDRDEARAGAALRVPHHLADRHQLSGQRAVADAARPAEGRAGRGRPLSLAAVSSGPANDLYRALDDTRFNLLVFGDAPSGRFRRHGPQRMSLPTMPRTTASSRAPTSAGRRSICCVRTAMSGSPGRASTRRRSGAGSPNAPLSARDRERA